MSSTPDVEILKMKNGVYRYKMDHPKRGLFLIFNHQYFTAYNKTKEENDQLGVRYGTDEDVKSLKNSAKILGFEEVLVYDDLTKNKIFEILESKRNENHSENDCFVCVILTHGGDEDYLYADDEKYKLTEVAKFYEADQCPSLAGKPKLFLVQACRGKKGDDGIRVSLTVREGKDEVDGLKEEIQGLAQPESDEIEWEGDVKIPVAVDFLFARSTLPLHIAWRNRCEGSWFIQCLTAVIRRYGTELELIQIMTLVNRKIAYGFESNTEDEKSSGKKQTTSVTTHLTAEMYFKPKGNNGEKTF